MSADYLLLEDDPLAAVERTAQVLKAGGVAVFPTDTVYGLFAAADCALAYRRIYHLKQRAPSKPLALLASTAHPLAGLARELLKPFARERRQFAGGGITLLIESAQVPSDALPAAVRSIQPGDIGVRQPAHADLQALLDLLGGLAWATSANAAAAPPAGGEQVLSWAERLINPPECIVTSKDPLPGHPSELLRLDGSGRLSRQAR